MRATVTFERFLLLSKCTESTPRPAAPRPPWDKPRPHLRIHTHSSPFQKYQAGGKQILSLPSPKTCPSLSSSAREGWKLHAGGSGHFAHLGEVGVLQRGQTQNHTHAHSEEEEEAYLLFLLLNTAASRSLLRLRASYSGHGNPRNPRPDCL